MSKLSTSIQLKRNKQTLIVTLKSLKVKDIRIQLHEIITSLGGLSSLDAADSEEDNEDEEDDIPIPVPTFGTTSDDEEEESDNEDKIDDIKAAKNKILPEISDIILGLPKDKSDAYAGFNDLLNDNEKLELKEFDILGFRLKDEDYKVVKPVQDYQEQETK